MNEKYLYVGEVADASGMPFDEESKRWIFEVGIPSGEEKDLWPEAFFRK